MSEPRVVDATGTWCPVPIRLAARALDPRGTTPEIVLLADDPLITVDLPAWCGAEGVELVSLVEEADGVFRAQLRRPACAGGSGNVRSP